jgi:protein-disulfide isomerase
VKLLKAIFVMLVALPFTNILHAETKETPAAFSTTQTHEIEKIVHDYLVANPQVMIEVVQKLQAQQRKDMETKAIKAVHENVPAIFNAPGSPVLGNKKGTVNLVEFFDYQCKHCKEASAIISQMISKNPNLRVILKELPIFPNSEYAARAALAAQIQGKFAEMNDALLKAELPLTNDKVLQIAGTVGLNAKQLEKDMQNDPIKNEIAQNAKLAEMLGLAGTPSFIVGSMKNDHLDKVFYLPGMTNQETMQDTINKAAG